MDNITTTFVYLKKKPNNLCFWEILLGLMFIFFLISLWEYQDPTDLIINKP